MFNTAYMNMVHALHGRTVSSREYKSSFANRGTPARRKFPRGAWSAVYRWQDRVVNRISNRRF